MLIVKGRVCLYLAWFNFRVCLHQLHSDDRKKIHQGNEGMDSK
jgi:hypothetical protein